MSPSEIVKARLDELRRDSEALYEQRGKMVDLAVAEKRGMTEAEQASYDDLAKRAREIDDQLPALQARVQELQAQEAAEARSAAVRVETGQAAQEQRSAPARVEDPPIYLRSGATGHSFFMDLAQVQTDGLEAREARERLHRNAKMVQSEQRAMGNTNATGGSGGEFAPPTWLVSDWINLLRPGRVTADLFTKAPIPPNTPSVSIPKLLSGTAVALQSSQNSTLATADITTGFVTTGFATIGGKAVWSQQLMDQSAIPFDQVISNDLAAAYNAYFANQIINGTGTGSSISSTTLNGLASATFGSTGTLTGTTAAAFYSAANGLLASFTTTRYARPTHWLMHPRRWYWLMAQVDANNRPLVVPADVAFNPMATNEDVQLIGSAPAGRFLGVPVVLDPNIPTNKGTGTNQDEVYLIKADDLWLFESQPQAEAFRSPYAEQLGILFRLYAYAGTIVNRQSASLAKLSGVGLVAPTF